MTQSGNLHSPQFQMLKVSFSIFSFPLVTKLVMIYIKNYFFIGVDSAFALSLSLSIEENVCLINMASNLSALLLSIVSPTTAVLYKFNLSYYIYARMRICKCHFLLRCSQKDIVALTFHVTLLDMKGGKSQILSHINFMPLTSAAVVRKSTLFPSPDIFICPLEWIQTTETFPP